MIVGHSGSDDAGVYRLSDDVAIVVTVDFFTPIVDDAYDYGRVAATNSLSDVYAMGGRPIVALNIAGFPENKIPPDVLGEIIRGGARVGDVLVLTKAIGTGVLATALKQRALSPERIRVLVDSMTQLNRYAAETMMQYDPHACTDITGFGLLGHAHEMAEGSGVTVEITASSVPWLEGAREAAEQGHLTGGGSATRRFMKDKVRIASSVDETTTTLLFDPQTSGGLLIAVAPERADALVAALKLNHPRVAIVGRCVAREATPITVA